jgi:hypothetical protein
MQKKKKVSIFIPILWTITTGIWIVTLCMNLGSDTTPRLLIVLQCVCVLASCVAAIANFIGYRRGKNNDEG